jgi:hypothetical protein
MVRMRRNPDGSVSEIPPERCPNGHPLRYPNVLVGWSPPAGMVGWLCLTCGMEVWRDGSTTQEAVPRLD